MRLNEIAEGWGRCGAPHEQRRFLCGLSLTDVQNIMQASDLAIRITSEISSRLQGVASEDDNLLLRLDILALVGNLHEQIGCHARLESTAASHDEQSSP